MANPFTAGAIVYAKHVARLARFYADVADLEIVHEVDDHSVLESETYELVVVALPAATAARIVIATPPVRRENTAFKLSLRLPPLVEGHRAAAELKTLLEDNAPYNAKVTFHADGRATALGSNGWNAPALAPWLERALNDASLAHYGAPCGYIGQGGTIPLMGMLQDGFPQAQMMVCGVLGPKSNAHGPNEFLHVPYAKKLTAAIAQVMAACA